MTAKVGLYVPLTVLQRVPITTGVVVEWTSLLVCLPIYTQKVGRVSLLMSV